MRRFAGGITAFEAPCYGLVQLIEEGAYHAAESRSLLHRAVDPMLDACVDGLVLGCTHYPFIRPLLEEISGPDVVIIDPAPAVARRARFVLQQRRLASPGERVGALRCFTSGDTGRLETLAARLIPGGCAAEQIHW